MEIQLRAKSFVNKLFSKNKKNEKKRKKGAVELQPPKKKKEEDKIKRMLKIDSMF